MEDSERYALRWEPITDLRFRIVPLLDAAMQKSNVPGIHHADLDPVREALAGWERAWQLASGAADVGAALSMYWHLEPDAAREYFIPRHIQSRLVEPPSVHRVLQVPDPDSATGSLQRILDPLNRHGCLLIKEGDDGASKRIGAVDSVRAVQVRSPATADGHWLLVKLLGYDQRLDATLAIHAALVERLHTEVGPAVRIQTFENHVYIARDRCHSYAWRYWLAYRAEKLEEFERLDEELLEEFLYRAARAC